MKVRVSVDYSDNSGECVYVARSCYGALESKLLGDEEELLKELLDLIQPRCRTWKCVDDH